MRSDRHQFLSLFALCAVSLSMLAEPVVGISADFRDQLWAETDSDTDDSDDDSQDDDLFTVVLAEPGDSFVLECRVALLSGDAGASPLLNGDPRGPPSATI